MNEPINRRKFSVAATAAAALAVVGGRPAAAAIGAAVSDERKSALIKAIKTVQAYQEISNLMTRFIFAMNYHQPDAILDCFALQKEDVSWEFADEGVFRGPAAVKQIIGETLPPYSKPGEMMEQQLCSPAIEIAGDLVTAKGWWRAPGFGTIPQVESLPVPIWNWDIIAADLTFDGNSWKVWHGHSFRTIKCKYHEGWVQDLSLLNRPNIPIHPLARPTTYHNPFSPISIRESIPACPIPYETWTDSSWMLERDKSK